MKQFGYAIKLNNGEFAMINDDDMITKIYSTPYLTYATIDDEINHIIGYVEGMLRYPEECNFRTDAKFSHIVRVSIEVIEENIDLEQAYEIFNKI